MIVGLGSDVIGIERVRDSLTRHGQRFLDRVYSAEEQSYCLGFADPAERLAARWAAKEATLKAMGTGLIGQMRMSEICVSHNHQGAPVLNLSGAVAEFFTQLPAHRLWCTLSHAAGVATATVIIEGLDPSAAPPPYEY